MLELVNVRKTFNPKTVNEKIALDGLNLLYRIQNKIKNRI